MYQRGNATGAGAEDLLSFVLDELNKIEQAFGVSDFIRLKELHVEPSRVFVGLTVLADGINWNPGSGQGVYTYYNGTWNKLG